MKKENINVTVMTNENFDKTMYRMIFNEPVDFEFGDQLIIEYTIGLSNSVTAFAYKIRKETDGEESR